MTVKEYLEAMISYLESRPNEPVYLCILAETPVYKAKHPLNYVIHDTFLSEDHVEVSVKAYRHILANRESARSFHAVETRLSLPWWDYSKFSIHFIQRQKIAFLKYLITVL